MKQPYVIEPIEVEPTTAEIVEERKETKHAQQSRPGLAVRSGLRGGASLDDDDDLD